MTTLPKQPKAVKAILAPFDPRTGNYIVYYETDNGIITVPAFRNKIDPFSLLYRPGEIDLPSLFAHDSGFTACIQEDLTFFLPHKDLDGFPLPLSRPAHFKVIIWEPDKLITLPGLPPTDILILFSRNVQKGEVSHADITNLHKMARDLKQDSCVYPPRSPESTPTEPIIQPPREAYGETDRHDQGQTTSQEQDLDPGPSEAPASESDPAAGTAAKPQKRSVGTKRKFIWIDPGFLELMEADGLSTSCIETYRIIKTYRKYPEKTHERPDGEGPRDRFSYSTIYQAQIVEYLKIRREDMKDTARGDRRKQAEKMGTSLRTVQYNIATLCRLGYIGRVYPGLPEVCAWLTDEQQARRIERHERHPQYGPQKYKVAIDKRQRGLLKTLDRKLRKAGLPPYHIYLKDLPK